MSAFDDLAADLRALGKELSPHLKTYSLTFLGVGGALVQDPETLNWVPGPSASITVPCRLKVTTSPQLLELLGVDRQKVAFIGHFGTLAEPLTRPEGVPYGSSCPLVFGGQGGILTLQQAYPHHASMHEQVQGERFLAVWRSGDA